MRRKSIDQPWGRLKGRIFLGKFKDYFQARVLLVEMKPDPVVEPLGVILADSIGYSVKVGFARCGGIILVSASLVLPVEVKLVGREPFSLEP
tara:strand:- start:697 stop:972 length:276 start_codon:yes stop_codon:yes gene_type:complete